MSTWRRHRAHRNIRASSIATPGGEGWTIRNHRAILRSEPYARADLGAASDVTAKSNRSEAAPVSPAPAISPQRHSAVIAPAHGDGISGNIGSGGKHVPGRVAGTIQCVLSRPSQITSRPDLHHLSALFGRREHWVADDLDGARGRSLYVRLRPPGTPGKWTDAAEGTHGDLLDLIRHRMGVPTLRAALDEARAFLALPAAPAAGEGSGDTYDGTHAEAYLHARGLARCRFATLRFHPELRYREGASVQRLPALVAAVTGDDGAVLGVQRTWLDPRSPAKAGVAAPRKALGRVYGRAMRFGRPADGALARDRGAGDHRRRRALRREPRRIRASARRRAAPHRARLRRGGGAGG